MISNTLERDRIFDGDEFNGTCVGYGATPFGAITPLVCDVDIDDCPKREWTSYVRIAKEKRGQKKLRPSRDDAFHNELFVVFGPELSAKKAVAALETSAHNIKKHGLLIGRAEDRKITDVETFDGEILGCRCRSDKTPGEMLFNPHKPEVSKNSNS